MITALVALIAFVVLYLAAMNYLIVAPGETRSFFGIVIQPNWEDLLFRQRGPFLFEPIGVVTLGPLVIFLSIPNIVIAVLLGLLVATNIGVSYYGFRALGMRGARGIHALMATVPALLSGAACCVPTLILVIGLQLTATLAAVWSLLLPISALLLVASLWWSLHRMTAERECEIARRPLRA